MNGPDAESGENCVHRIVERPPPDQQRERIEIALHRHGALDAVAREARSTIQSSPTALSGTCST